MAMFMPEPYRDEDEVTIFDCAQCGDGDALRVGEECAYCGRTKDEDG